jgi:hypothetical protein
MANRVRFSSSLVSELDEQSDLIIPKDAFEHIIDVPGMLISIRDRLKDDGQVYIGFSPLYHSPYGDHDRRLVAFSGWGIFGRLIALMPWGQLLFERLIFENHPKIYGNTDATIADLNLNKMTVKEFRQYIREGGFEIRTLLANRGRNPIGQILGAIRRFPSLENFCTYNVYCVLEKAA